jgi:hypothetical protein
MFNLAHNHFLLPYEQHALLEALRRDLRIQQELAGRPGPWINWHQYNARMAKRLLNALNPKRTLCTAESTEHNKAFQLSSFVAATYCPSARRQDETSTERLESTFSTLGE